MILIIGVIFNDCTTRDNKNEIQEETISDQIVLFNLGDTGRQEIATAIDRINGCSPKIIAINAIFEDNSHSWSDSVLLNSIIEAKNVILVSNLMDNKLVNSDSIFLKGSMAQGVLNYGFTEERVSKYKTYLSWNNQLLWSFPVTIASYFDLDLSERVMNETKANQFYKIKFYSTNVNYKSISIDELEKSDCKDIKDKIILIGYLGPNEDDLYPIDDKGNSNKKVYSTIIIANIISSILKNKFEEY